MAYNPFDVFRRNQKTLFAVLTVFIMIMFTLSFGAGDFFQWLPTLIGRGTGQGEVVAKIDGDKITEGDLQRINTHRLLASEFMMQSAAIAIGKIDEYITQASANLPAASRPLFTQLQQSRLGQRFGDRRYPYLTQFQDIFQAEQYPEQAPLLIRRNMNQIRNYLSAIANNASTSKEDKDLIMAFQNLMNLDQRVMDASVGGYFGHRIGGDDSLRPALDFTLWLRKAAQLGINYSEADAKRMYLEEFYSQLDSKALAEMEQAYFASKPGYSRELIFKALAEEFRVQTAQNIVLGRSNALQTFATPWDAYEFYRKQCNGGTYSVIAIPSDNYLAKVTGTPSEKELRDLFHEYRDKEADPSKRGVGLREPRKLKIGWLEVTGEEPYYTKLGPDSVTLVELQAKAAAMTLVPELGAGFGLIAAPIISNIVDPALLGAYTATQQKHANDLDLAWFPFFSEDSLRRVGVIATSLHKPSVIARAAGVAAGSIGTFAGPLPMALMLIEQARHEDRMARAKALVPLFTVPTDAGSMLLGPVLAAGAALPPPLPLAVVRNELLERVRAEIVQKIVKADIDHFSTELMKLAAKPDKSEAKAYIEKFVKERGLKSGESTRFDSQWTIGDDPGLKPLVDKAKRGHSFADAPFQFGRSFFFTFAGTDFRNQREVPTTTLFEAQPFPDTGSFQLVSGEPSYLAWRSAEQPAETPRDFQATRPKVEELWRRLEARKLAEAAANEVAKQVRQMAEERGVAKKQDLTTTPACEAIVHDAYAKLLSQFTAIDDKARVDFFAIENVSPISIPQRAFVPASQIQPSMFDLRPRREMPYPTAKMEEELLAHKDDPPATTLVLHSESRDRWYVAVLVHRQERRGEEFYEQVFSGVTPLSNVILGQLQRVETGDAFRNAVELLRAEFKVAIENDKLK